MNENELDLFKRGQHASETYEFQVNSQVNSSNHLTSIEINRNMTVKVVVNIIKAAYENEISLKIGNVSLSTEEIAQNQTKSFIGCIEERMNRSITQQDLRSLTISVVPSENLQQNYRSGFWSLM